MLKDLFHFQKKTPHCPPAESCSFLREDCIKQKCLFWIDDFENIRCLNQKEAFAAALAIRELRASRGALLEIFKSPQSAPLKKLLISVDLRDGLIFFESLLPEERGELTHSIAGMDFKNSREKNMALANVFQMAASMKKDSFENFMGSIKKGNEKLFQLFQRMDWWDYEDLQFLDDQGMNRWLKEISHAELWLALKLCGRNVKERIHSLITENAVKAIRTFDQEKEKPSRKDIKKVHQYILRLVIVFSEMGEIGPPLESCKRLPGWQKESLPVSEEAEAEAWVLGGRGKNWEGAEAICPLIHSPCAKEKCLFWNDGSLSEKQDEECLIISFNGLLFSKKEELDKEVLEKLIPVLADWSFHMDQEEMKLVFASMREEVQVETIFWILSTIYPKSVESSPGKKQFFSEVMKELKMENPSKFDNKAFDPVSDVLKPFLLTTISEIIQGLPFKRRDFISRQIRLRDANIYKDMELYGWYAFDDLAGLSDRDTQCWLKEVNAEDLLLAMKLCGDKVKDKIFNNMSDRAAAMMAEDLSSLGPVRMIDVEKSQKAILKVVRAFMAEKKIKGWR